MGSRGRPEESRAAILDAAVREFSREGVAGARTDAIARAARVNKALLYYYFKDKEALYNAVLDQVFGGLLAAIEEVLSRDLPLCEHPFRLHRQSPSLPSDRASRNDERQSRTRPTS